MAFYSTNGHKPSKTFQRKIFHARATFFCGTRDTLAVSWRIESPFLNLVKISLELKLRGPGSVLLTRCS